ncbi:hypothetical protein JTB14_021441, partial [Gonioctena quinquepunctata]
NISLDEFSDACNLIKKHMPCLMTTEQLREICNLMDLNKDGLVDLNEFLESLRMVDPECQQKNQLGSPVPSLENQPNFNHKNVKEPPNPLSSNRNTNGEVASSNEALKTEEKYQEK